MNHIETIIKESNETIRIMRNKSNLEDGLAKALKAKWPAVETVSLGTYKIYLYTEKHVIETYTRKWEPELKMTCDGKMPDTVEEFLQAKSMIEQDGKDALNALYHIFFNMEECYGKIR